RPAATQSTRDGHEGGLELVLDARVCVMTLRVATGLVIADLVVTGLVVAGLVITGLVASGRVVTVRLAAEVRRLGVRTARLLRRGVRRRAGHGHSIPDLVVAR